MEPSSSRRAAPASRRRFAVTVILFALANAAVLFWIWRQFRPPAAAFRIAGVSPEETLEDREPLAITFERDAIPWNSEGGASSERSQDGSGLLELEPAVAGRAFWRDARTLVFEPAGGWPEAVRVRVTVSGEVGRPLGLALAGERSFDLRSNPLELVSARQVGFTDDLEATVRLAFTGEVAPQELEAHLALLDGEGKPFDFDLPAEEPSRLIDVQARGIVDALNVRLQAGLRGTGGPLGLERDTERRVPLTYRLRLVGARSRPVFQGSPTLRLRFNNPLASAENDLGRYIEVAPRVDFRVRRGGRSSTIELEGDFAPGETYRVTARQGLPGAGGSVLLSDQDLEVSVPDRRRAAIFDRSFGYLSAGGSGRLRIRSANLPALRVVASRVPPVNLVHYLGTRSWFRKRFLAPEVSRTVTIDAPENRVVESALEVRDVVGDDARGLWYLRLEDEKSRFFDDLLLSVTDMGLTARAWKGGLLVWVTSLASGEPVADARVRLLARNGSELAAAATDADGLVRFEASFLDRSASSRRERLELIACEKEGDLSFLEIERRRLSQADFDVRGRPYLDRGYEAFLLTERGVYRPGERVHLLALLRDRALSAPGEFPVELEVLRPDRRRLALLRGTLGSEGAVSFELDVPEAARTGRHRALLRLPGDDDVLGSTAFFVEDFLPDRLRLRVAVAGDGKTVEGAETADGGRDPAQKDDSNGTSDNGTGQDRTSRRGRSREGTIGDLEQAELRRRPGDPLGVEVTGEFLAGLPASDAPCTLRWKIHRAAFEPRDLDDFRFGDALAKPLDLKGSAGSERLDESGQTRFDMKVPEARSALPLSLRLTAEGRDVSGRTVRAETAVAVDPLPFYVGIRRAFEGRPKAGAPAPFEIAAVSPDGSPHEAPALEVIVTRCERRAVLEKSSSGRYRYRSSLAREEIERRGVTLEGGRGSLRLAFPGSGHYELAVVLPCDEREADEPEADGDEEAPLLARTSLYVTGGAWSAPPDLEKPERLELSLSPERPLPGENVRVTVRAPFAGRLLLTTETDRVLSTSVTRLADTTGEVEIPTPADATANLWLTATVVRGVVADGTEGNAALEWLPFRARGIVPVPFDFSRERLAVAIDAPGVLEPRSRAELRVRVEDARGEPADAVVAIALVDEGILARTNYETPDPWAFFRARRALGVRHADLYGVVLREVPRDVPPARPGGGKDEANAADEISLRRASRRLSPVRARRVVPAALWLGTARTGEDGVVLEDVELPPFTGELRAMAIAWRGPLFGSGERRITVRAPVHIESGLPRVLATGDRFFSEAQVFNATGSAGELRFERDIEGPLSIATVASGEPDARLLEDGASARFRGELAAGDEPGRARVTLRATLGTQSIEETTEIAVRPAAPPVRHTRSGRVRAGEPLALSLDETYYVEGSVHRRLVLGPLPEVELLGALDYLVRYPHGCLEQTTSRVFPLLFLSDLAELAGARFAEAAGEPEAEGRKRLDRAATGELIRAGIRRILSLQGRGGWLAMWPSGRRAWPWGTVYSTHFLVEARRAGHEVPEFELSELMRYLGELAAEERADEVARAYAAYVLALAGEEPRAAVERLASALEHRREEEAVSGPALATSEGHRAARARPGTRLRLADPPPPSQGTAARRRPPLPPGARPSPGEAASRRSAPPREAAKLAEARFLLAAAAALLGERDRAHALLGDALPSPAKHREGGGTLFSPARRSALLLATILEVDPSSPWVPALVQRLEGRRVGGRWATTQENAFALLALGKYARFRNASRGDYTARVRVGDEEVELAAPDTPVFGDEELAGGEVTVEVDGAGELYWFLEEEGVPADGRVDELDSGVVLRRRYLDAEENEISGRPLRRGEVVIVELRIEGVRRLENLVITDILPAGLEVENPRLGGAVPEGTFALSAHHFDIRDDRVLIYTTLPRRGEATYRYAARAVTAGDFALPPASVESFYDPAVTSRHGAGRLKIVEGE